MDINQSKKTPVVVLKRLTTREIREATQLKSPGPPTLSPQPPCLTPYIQLPDTPDSPVSSGQTLPPVSSGQTLSFYSAESVQTDTSDDQEQDSETDTASEGSTYTATPLTTRTGARRRHVRNAYSCPKCGKSVKKLTAHLRRVHKYNKEEADRLRAKQPTRQKQYAKRRRHKFDCPYPGCLLSVYCLKKHLMTHGLVGQELINVSTTAKRWVPHEPQIVKQTRADRNPDTGTLLSKGMRVQSRNTRLNYVTRHFYEWLASPTGHGQEAKPATQHAVQVQKYWDQTGIDNLDAFQKQPISVWYTNRNQHVPGTVLSYLSSLRKFFDYALESGLMKNTTEQMAFIKRCESMMRKKKSVRKAEVATQSVRELLPEDALKEFRSSAFYAQTIQEVKNGNTSDALMDDLRNLLLVDIVFCNGSRPSVLLNMSINDVRKAKPEDVDGKQVRVISISRHKTTSAHGAAAVTVTMKQYQLLFYLIGMLENLGVLEGNVFIRLDNQAPTTSWINKCLNVAWKKAKCQKFGFLSCTRIRKAITTICRDKDPTFADDVAAQLCHRRATADAHYHAYNVIKKSAQTVSKIHRHMTTNSSSESESPKPPAVESDIDMDSDVIPPSPQPGPSAQTDMAIDTSDEERLDNLQESLNLPSTWHVFSSDCAHFLKEMNMKEKTRIEKSRKGPFHRDDMMADTVICEKFEKVIKRKYGKDIVNFIRSQRTELQGLNVDLLIITIAAVARHYGLTDPAPLATTSVANLAEILRPAPPTEEETSFKTTMDDYESRMSKERKEEERTDKILKSMKQARRRQRIRPAIEEKIRKDFEREIKYGMPPLLSQVKSQLHRYQGLSAKQVVDKIRNIIKQNM